MPKSVREQLYILNQKVKAQTQRLSRRRLARLDCGDRMLIRDELESISRRLAYVNEVCDAGCSVLVDALREGDADV